MRFRSPPVSRDERDETIRRLESDLYMARLEIVRLAPEQFQSVLESFHSCASRTEAYQWRDEVADKVVEAAVPISDGMRPDLFGERGYCPLCNGGAQNYYAHQRGFSLPEGLRRHLVGFGNIRECPVMKAAMALARESWNRRFSVGEAAEAVAAKQTQEKRRATEPLYVIGPAEDGVLVDEGFFFSRQPRPAEGAFSLTWAEQRLFGLGFQIQVDGRRRSYTKRIEHAGRQFVMYGDPRRLGEISFRVFDASITRGKKLGIPLNTFRIRDGWKNHLAEKVAAGIEAASKSPRR